MEVVTDAHGKVLRVGDTVHKASARRTINKKEANGRVLDDQKTFRVRQVAAGCVRLRDSGRSKYTVVADSVVKE